jgi:hypothetical protein
MIQFPAMVRDVPHIQKYRLAVGTTKPPISSNQGTFPPGRVVEHDVDNSPPLVQRLRMSGAIPSLPTCLHGVQEDNVTFIKISTSKNKKYFHV